MSADALEEFSYALDAGQVQGTDFAVLAFAEIHGDGVFDAADAARSLGMSLQDFDAGLDRLAKAGVIGDVQHHHVRASPVDNAAAALGADKT